MVASLSMVLFAFETASRFLFGAASYVATGAAGNRSTTGIFSRRLRNKPRVPDALAAAPTP